MLNLRLLRKSIQASHVSPLEASYLQARGTVTAPIPPGKRGRIRVNGSYWSAQSVSFLNWTIPIGTEITTIGRSGCTLLIAPVYAESESV